MTIFAPNVCVIFVTAQMLFISNGMVSAFTIPPLPSSTSAVIAATSTITSRSTLLLPPSINNQIRASRTARRTTVKLQMSLEPLAKEGSWTAYLDETNTGLVYYFNTITGESSWDPPTPTFPKVKMSRRKEAKMAAMKRQYNDNNNDESNSVNGGDSGSDDTDDIKTGFGGGGIFTSFFAPQGSNESAKVVDEINGIEDAAKNAKEGTPIFKIFGSNSEDSTSSSESTTTNDVTNGATTNGAPNGAMEEEAQQQQPSFLNNLFGKKQNGSSDITEPNGVETEEPVNGVNGGSTPTNGSNEAAPAFLNNLFGQPKAVVNGGGVQVEVEEVVEEEEFYDQMQFEDAVIAEEEVEVPTPIKLEIGSKIMPHPEKMSWGGEDALFVSGKSFGVFDGVSGAEKLDGVPLYSVTLAKQLKSSVGKEGLTVDEIKAKMLKAAEYADMSATGASTAVVASIGDDDMLRAVNLGDSVLMIIRDGAITARVKETVHYFDCPYQLSDDSPDRPRNGSVLQTKLQKGDLILSGSDGVFDNLTDLQVIEIVQNNSKATISKIAQQIVSESRKISKDPNAPTPYAKAARKNNYAQYSQGVGGKIDDISCVAVRCK